MNRVLSDRQTEWTLQSTIQCARVNCWRNMREITKGNIRKIPSNKACQAHQVIILSSPPRKKGKKSATVIVRAHAPPYMHGMSAFIRKCSAQSEKEFFVLSFRFSTSDMRGKCIRAAERPRAFSEREGEAASRP